MPVASIALFAAALAAPSLPRIDSLVLSQLKQRRIPGASVAVVREGKIVHLGGYGLADIENNVKASPRTVYQIGSVTKQFTSALVMQQVEEGKVKLDEPVGTYLPDLPDSWKPVTVRQLLTHTSGIKSYTGVLAFQRSMRDPGSPEALLDLVGQEPFDFTPGERWSYNNTGYYLLGMLVQRVGGKPYHVLLKERIFDPVGMASSSVNDWQAIVPRRARGYDRTPNGFRNAAYVDMGWPFAAGAMLSTVEDLAKWTIALEGEKVLKKSSKDAMWSPVRLNDGKRHPYGFGWAFGERNGIRIIDHGGAIPGFSSIVVMVPSKRLSVVVLCNTLPDLAEQVSKEILGEIDPALKIQPAKTIKDEDPALSTRLAQLFADLAAGKERKEDYGEALWSAMHANPENPPSSMLKDFGPLKKLEPFSYANNDGVKRAAYRATFEKQVLRVEVVLGKDGKVEGLMLRPE